MAERRVATGAARRGVAGGGSLRPSRPSRVWGGLIGTYGAGGTQKVKRKVQRTQCAGEDHRGAGGAVHRDGARSSGHRHSQPPLHGKRQQEREE